MYNWWIDQTNYFPNRVPIYLSGIMILTTIYMSNHRIKILKYEVIVIELRYIIYVISSMNQSILDIQNNLLTLSPKLSSFFCSDELLEGSFAIFLSSLDKSLKSNFLVTWYGVKKLEEKYFFSLSGFGLLVDSIFFLGFSGQKDSSGKLTSIMPKSVISCLDSTFWSTAVRGISYLTSGQLFCQFESGMLCTGNSPSSS